MWTPDLERHLIDALRSHWHAINREQLRGALRPAALRLAAREGTLGTWERATRTITLSTPWVITARWGQVVEVLKHEIAHQYVDEVLGVRDEGPHGAAFQRVCARMGVDAAAAGEPEVEDPEISKLLRRIRKLLALADSPNPHEAEAAARRAQRLLLEHDLAAVQSGEARRYRSREVGTPKGRIDAHERLLAGLITRFFFVDAVWVPAYLPEEARYGQVLELIGSPENLDVAEWVHGFVLATAASAWDRYRATSGAVGGQRRRFLSGVMTGFSEQLAAGKREAEAVGLVHVGDAGLKDWVRRRFPRLRSVRADVVADDAWHAGRAEGREIRLHKPIREGPTGPIRQLG